MTTSGFVPKPALVPTARSVTNQSLPLSKTPDVLRGFFMDVRLQSVQPRTTIYWNKVFIGVPFPVFVCYA
jgi:hypothetical protein